MDDKDWVIVGPEDAREEERLPARGCSTSGHFDLTLGRGQWKHTLFSVDWSCGIGPPGEPAAKDTTPSTQHPTGEKDDRAANEREEEVHR